MSSVRVDLRLEASEADSWTRVWLVEVRNSSKNVVWAVGLGPSVIRPAGMEELYCLSV